MTATVFAVIGALTLLIALVYGVAVYNGLIQVSNNIKKAWTSIDVRLKQRHDEIPN